MDIERADPRDGARRVAVIRGVRADGDEERLGLSGWAE